MEQGAVAARAALAETRSASARSRGQVARTLARLTAWFPDLPLPASPGLITSPQLPPDLDRLRQAVVENSHEIGYVEDLALKARAIADQAQGLAGKQRAVPDSGLEALPGSRAHKTVRFGQAPGQCQDQAERVIGGGLFATRDTEMFNGYGDEVASLYAGMDLRKNY